MKLTIQILFFFVVIGLSSNLAAQKRDSIIRKAVIIPKSQYVLSGTVFKADIFLSEYKPQTDDMVKVEGKEIKMENGIATYEAITYGEGERKVYGYITTTNQNGGTINTTFETNYVVFKAAATISADKMNVLYIGLDNPISVSVPGYTPEKVTVTMAGGLLSKVRNTSYIAKVTTMGEATISVSVKMDDGSTRSMGSMRFRVRNIPTPITSFGTIMSGDVQPVDVIKSNAGRIFCSLGEGFTFEGVRYSVKSFSFRIIKTNGVVTEVVESLKGTLPKDTASEIEEGNSEQLQKQPDGTGDRLPKEALSQIEAIQPGDIILIDKIRVIGPDGERDAQPIIITAK